MDDDQWQPLGPDQTPTDRSRIGYGGVPPWMERSLVSWQRKAFSAAAIPYGAEQLLGQAEVLLRISVPEPGPGWSNSLAGSLIQICSAEGKFLALTDFLLASQRSPRRTPAEHLRGELAKDGSVFQEAQWLLKNSGSVWTIGIRSGKVGLVKRLAAGVEEAVQHAAESSGHAGNRLREAWQAAYGLNPNPSHAYALAIKAVEDAAVPVISPKDRTATLGKIIGAMDADGGWSLPLARESAVATNSSTVVSMMRMLWTAQADRHGGHDLGLVITQESAETAVVTAAALVQWFASGAIGRR